MEPFGFLVVDKPQGKTSHDIVAAVRRGTRIKRIGHAGTLDPMATGVLVLCIGAATRLSEYVMASTKQYTATVQLGIETDSYDADGQVIATHNMDHISRADVEAALAHFQGEVEQIPPMYSAIKQGGKKLYEIAREGKEVDRAARKVWLQTTLVEVPLPEVKIRVVCSAGTYIRSIAHDLGARLGVGAHLTALRREASGALNEPIAWQTLLDAMVDGTWQRFMVDERRALPSIPELTLSITQLQDILHGRAIPCAEPAANGDLRRAYGPGGQFIAILEAQQGRQQDCWKPEKVFLQE